MAQRILNLAPHRLFSLHTLTIARYCHRYWRSPFTPLRHSIEAYPLRQQHNEQTQSECEIFPNPGMKSGAAMKRGCEANLSKL